MSSAARACAPHAGAPGFGARGVMYCACGERPRGKAATTSAGATRGRRAQPRPRCARRGGRRGGGLAAGPALDLVLEERVELLDLLEHVGRAPADETHEDRSSVLFLAAAERPRRHRRRVVVGGGAEKERPRPALATGCREGRRGLAGVLLPPRCPREASGKSSPAGSSSPLGPPSATRTSLMVPSSMYMAKRLHRSSVRSTHARHRPHADRRG